ncbi:MAG TPA: hypothetical protein VJ865_02795 [Gemmatimonadaceae bacterium]|nr:hypothetical protein [Gemmatimonadaceae bacterium]
MHHLVAVWNPAYGGDIVESHIRILRDFAEKFRAKQVEEDDVYVWWGKIRSSHRLQPLPHIDKILALENELTSEEGVLARELQLYLTDYRSLYVAHVGEITGDDVREEDEDEHIPALYLNQGINCDCWFRVLDIRRLVSDDTLSVVEELSKLRNMGYHGNPVSIYGGMVDLPLIVTRPDGARYFDPYIREQLTEGRHWVEFDAERGGIGATERELREHCFGEEAWSRLDPGTRTFVATAEKLYRDHRSDMAFDFSPVLIDFAKAFEVQTNILLRRAMETVAARDRLINLDGRSVDVATGGPFMLGDLARIIGDSPEINQALRRKIAPQYRDWFVASLPAILRDLGSIRNPAAHSSQLDRHEVQRHRNQYLGVGCEGELVKLAKVRFA